MKTLFEKLLDYYHINKEEYEYLTRPVSLNDIPSPSLFKDMDKAVELVKKHVQNNDKIVIYGDYDVDGITGCSILVKALKLIGFSANYYIPNRYLDGYGINNEKAKEIIDKKYNLVITVDNGISANEPIKLLRENGIDVLVIDHHERQEILPDANVIIHPNVSGYSTLASSGAFTAYMFSKALLGRDDKYLSTLAGISLISDMMPLKDFNRDFLRSVISSYQKGEFLAIDLLLDDTDFDDLSIGMSIAPKLNAIGRLDKTININRLVKYLTSDNKEEILNYKYWINSINNERKEKTKDAKSEIIDNLKDYKGKSLVVVCDVEEGLLGLIANQLMNTLKIPVIVFTHADKEPNILKGSGRSIEGFNLAQSFIALKDLLDTYGGHALAAGISLKEENFEKFKLKFAEIVENTPLEKPQKEYLDLSINEINMESVNLIRSFSPFGEGWKSPLLRIRHIKTDSLMYSKTKEHVMTTIGYNTRILAFNYPKEEMDQYSFVDMIGSLRLSSFGNNQYVEFVASDIEESN